MWVRATNRPERRKGADHRGTVTGAVLQELDKIQPLSSPVQDFNHNDVSDVILCKDET